MAKAAAQTAPRDRHRSTLGPPTRRRGPPRDERIDEAILTVAGQQLEERGYAGMSMESVAAAAGTTVPSLRRRYHDTSALAAAVVDSLRVEALPVSIAGPRNDALAILENFQQNLQRPRAMATLGSILAEEHRHPGLLERFRTRLVQPRRAMLCQALYHAISSGELPAELDVQAASNMLIGSFYARYLSGDQTPNDWAERVFNLVWPVHDRSIRGGLTDRWRMLVGEPGAISVGDRVLVPWLPEWDGWSISVVTDDYYFEPLESAEDFGHVVPVELRQPNVNPQHDLVSAGLRAPCAPRTACSTNSYALRRPDR